MAQELDGAREKLRWARRHTALLHAEMSKLNKPDGKAPFTTRKEFDRQQSCIFLRVDTVEELPNDFALMLGDALYHYRSALDHIAWQLARRQQGRTPRSNASFPIAVSRERFHSPAVWTLIWEIGTKDRRMIENLQPYRQPFTDESAKHPLALLSSLHNKDKHRLLHIVATANTNMTVRIDRDDFVDCEPSALPTMGARAVGYRLRPGMELARAPIHIKGPNPNVTFQVTGGSVFSVAEIDDKGRDVPLVGIPDRLERISEAVDHVLRTFDPVFPV